MLKKQNFLVFFYQEMLLSRKTADNQEGSLPMKSGPLA